MPNIIPSAIKNEKLDMAKQINVFLCLFFLLASAWQRCGSPEEATVARASCLAQENLAEAWLFGGGGGRSGTTLPGT